MGPQQLEQENRTLARALKRGEKRVIYYERLLDQTQHLLNTRIDELEQARSELRQRTAELEESEMRFKQLADASFEGIIIHENGVILDANEAAILMHGYVGDDMFGVQLKRLVDEESWQEVSTHVCVGAWEPYEVNHVRRNNALFSVEAREREIVYKGKPAHVIAIRDITERKAMEEELQRLACTDSLTGVANRRHFFDLCNKEYERAHRYGHTVSALMLDIDHFKRINDNFGHSAGDRAIQVFAETCIKSLRDSDVFGRLGGEEFAAVLPHSTLENARRLAERLRVAVSEAQFRVSNGWIGFTVSIGVAEMTPRDETIEALIKRADEVLFTAKGAGRNRVDCA